MANFSREKFHDPRFELHHGDALDFDRRILFAERNVKLIGNLPYYIASQLLCRFVDFPNCIHEHCSCYKMRWRDVFRRSPEAPITARSRCDSNFIITLSICERFRAQFLFPGRKSLRQLFAFTPRDEKRIGIFDPAVFREVVKHGFSQRRKQLRKLLASHVGDWECISKKIAAPLTARAEELSLKQWIALANHIAPRDEKIAARASAERFPAVDENDRQIGTSNRLEVHENNFRHRAIHILVFNHSGEVLLQKRSPWKDRHPLLWDSSAAGHVEANEDDDEAAAR